MLIAFKYTSSLCISTLCHEKQVIWAYYSFLCTYHVLSKSLVFVDIFEESYMFAVIMDPFPFPLFLATYFKQFLLN